MTRPSPIRTFQRLLAAAALVAGSLPAPTHAQPYFTGDPVWSSGISHFTHMVAVGDVDGDGFLDLVCANSGEPNTFYPNEDGALMTSAIWGTRDAGETRGVALGDVDGDGDLDVVFGNGNQQNTLHENLAGTFTIDPVWWSDSTFDTRSVALADIDGDGDLDLVCGNSGQRNTAYLNHSGTLSTSPDWYSSEAHDSRSIALGDVNGDGALDLVCGNGGPITLYLNTGTALADTIAWQSALELQTLGIALGDVDGDGDLDLAVANEGSTNSLYINNGVVFADTSVWVTEDADTSYDIALGDVDGDQDLDIVVANSGEQNVLYLNNGVGVFSTAPDWMSTQVGATKSLVLADIEGDGDLDIVCGNGGLPSGINTMYRNEQLKLSAGPVWQSGVAEASEAVALGDVDGDGDLDAVYGNANSSSVLHVNINGVLEAVSSWSSVETAGVMDVAVGDVDRDGSPDLALAVDAGPNSLYLNEGTTFATAPEWVSGSPQSTTCVALGDLNRDGLLDVVWGNLDEPNEIYPGTGRAFADVPSWQSSRSYPTTDVALADLDGDGALDLVAGNLGAPNTAYMSRAGFPTLPSWQSAPSNVTQAIALGDIDGNGAPDLVCANGAAGTPQVNTLYLNRSGTFSLGPDWSSSAPEVSTGVALGDVDGDGDLDVLFSNEGFSSLYLNSGGVLSTTASWTSDIALASRDVAFGDIDMDGDLDATFANGIDTAPVVNTLFDGTKNGPWPSGIAPRDQLANNDAFVRNVRVAAAGQNVVDITFTAVDVESDPLYILPAYHYEGSTKYESPQVSGLPYRIGPLATAPDGVEHSFQWDYSLLPIFPPGLPLRNGELRVLATSSPERVSLTQRVPSYLKQLGRLIPLRADLSLTPEALNFPLVTVGDTVTVALTALNVGNLDLVISDIFIPLGDMTIDRALPLTIPPARFEIIEFSYQPVGEITIPANATVFSNDLFEPEKNLLLTTRVLGLAFTTRLLNDTPLLPVNEAVTVVVTPEPGVHVEGGTLYFRPTGEPVFDSTPLVAFASSFVALIPADAVTEVGVEYYTEVFNSGVFETDPLNAPTNVYSRAVETPAEVQLRTVAFPNSPKGFEELRDIGVTVDLPPGFTFVSGRVHARRGGEASYSAHEFDPSGPLPAASIPASLVGSRGVEYWVEVETATRTLTEPSIEPAGAPMTIPITVSNLEEPLQHPGLQYRMVTVPLDFGGDVDKTLEAILSDQTMFGPYDPVKWRSFRYLPTESRYIEAGQTDPRLALAPGRAFWLIARESNRVDTDPVDGRSTPTADLFEITLEQGWNQIGNPFNFVVDWDSVLVDTVAMSDAQDVLVQGPVAWVSDRGFVQDVKRLEPWEGYWVKNMTSAPVALRVPPRESLALQMAVQERNDDLRTWSIEITASSRRVLDGGSLAGVRPGAADGWDAHDRARPPLPPGRFVSVYFPHGEWTALGDAYARDVRSQGEAGHVWRFDVAKGFRDEAAGDEVLLRFGNVGDVPATMEAIFVDRALDRVVDLRDRSRYRFFLGERSPVAREADTRFAIVVGGKGYVEDARNLLAALPSATALHQNYPNPFNPSTIIRYDVAAGGQVALRVYDVTGALVKTLENRERTAGRYEVGWNGDNARGERVASGVYFYRLTAPGFTQTRKMIVIK